MEQPRFVSRPSPNFSQRACGPVDLLLLHYTGMPSCDGAVDWLSNPESKVSSHYTLAEDGTVFQHVDEACRAHHAGVSCWGGETDINSRSIGIEICNGGHDWGLPDFPKAQISALIVLCKDIMMRHAIAPARVLAHSDVAPARKRDPGERFPWRALAQKGVGHWVKPAPLSRKGAAFCSGDGGAHVAAYQRLLSMYGYGLEVTGSFDEQTVLVTLAFQRHFRPAQVDGIADPSTVATLHALIKALPRV